MSDPKDKLIVALDVDTLEEARGLVEALGESVDIYKVGSQLFTACGPVVIRHLMAQGKKVFLDLKFHDIPNTVANAVSAAVGLGQEIQKPSPSRPLIGAYHFMNNDQGRSPSSQGLFMCTLHTQGGQEMLEKAVEAAAKRADMIGVRRPILVGITVLTSDAKTDNITDIVLQRARLAKRCGLDGVVSSSEEAALIRKEFGKDFVIVTPGIRPKGVDSGDQKRITTPFEAISNGSDFLVVGRPIVSAKDPYKAADAILKEIKEAQK